MPLPKRAALFVAFAALLTTPAFGQQRKMPDLPERQQRAITAIERLGGYASRYEKLPGNPVTSVGFDFNYPIADRDLEWVSVFPALRSLNVSRSKITDAGLERLSACTLLETLNIARSPITA